MNIKREILNKLLDKYENSAHFKNEAKVNRRISVPLKPSLYDIQNPTMKQAVHLVLSELEAKQLVTIQWFEKDHIAKQVHLNLDNVEQVYREIKRPEKKKALQQTKELCQPLHGDPTWVIDFLNYIASYIDTKHKVPGILPSEYEQQKNLLIVLRAIAQLDDEEVLERVFSKRHLKDSKYFETHLRGKTTKILEQYKLKSKDLTTDEVLQQAGLFRSSDELMFTGPIEIEVNNQTINFTPLKHGAAIGARTVKELKITNLQANTIITIENKASYREYCNQMDDRTLAIYLAGFPGPMKKLFLRKLYEYKKNYHPETRFLHWGDIDLGGFRIYRSLKDVVPVIRPYLMDQETLLRNRDQCQELSKGYAILLKGLLEDEGYWEFHKVIEIMIRENLRLEQEGLFCQVEN